MLTDQDARQKQDGQLLELLEEDTWERHITKWSIVWASRKIKSVIKGKLKVLLYYHHLINAILFRDRDVRALE